MAVQWFVTIVLRYSSFMINVSSAQQGCIYFVTNSVKTEQFGDIFQN